MFYNCAIICQTSTVILSEMTFSCVYYYFIVFKLFFILSF